HDQLNVTGTVDLGGATLTTSLPGSFTPPANAVFVLIRNDGTDPVVGTFAGLPQRAGLTLNGVPFRIIYNGGDGNAVVLLRTTATTTLVTASPNTSVYGQEVTFSATVSPVATGSGIPTGTVTFTIDNMPQAPIPLSGGLASFSTTILTAGSHT